MTKHYKKLLILIITMLLTASVFCGVVAMANGSNVSNVSWSDVSIEEYGLGNEFTVPSRTVNVNGVSYDTKSTVILPDGTATSATFVVFQQPGVYTIQYSAEVDGVPFIKEEVINVKYSSYSFADSDTDVTYLEKGDYKFSPNTEGVRMSIQSGDKVTVEEIITVPDVNEDVLLSSLFIAPKDRAIEFRRLWVVFTDVYNPDSCLRFVFNGNWYESEEGFSMGGSYVLAGGANQSLKADDNGKIYGESGYGRYVYGGFYALDYKKQPIDPSTAKFDLYFNPSTCVVSIKDNYQKIMKTIIDTDNSDYYGENLWKGFESGKVKMSLYGENFISNAGNVVVTYIKDVNLKSEYVNDTVGPDIFVDCDYGVQDMPFARVGSDSYYPIPKARAIDIYSGECQVKTYAYYNYPSASAYQKEIKDGKFLTDEFGQYAIVYRATDLSGNTSEYVIPVRTSKNIENIDVVIPIDKVTQSFVGEKVIIPTPEYFGGSGKTILRTIVEHDDLRYSFDESQEEWSFVPEECGDWKVTYTVTDYTGFSYEESYVISVNKSSVPIFKNKPILPQILIDGFEYELPVVEVYDFTGESLIMGKAYIEITDANNTHKYNVGEKYVPKVINNKDKITIVYKYDYNGDQVLEMQPIEVPVVLGFVDDGYNKSLCPKNYFYTQDDTFVINSTIKGSTFVVTNEDDNWQGNSSWMFANALLANNLSINFNTFKENNFYDAITIKFADLENPNISVSAKILKTLDGKLMFSVGENLADLNLNFNDDNSFAIKLSNKSLSINGVALNFAKNDDGSEFFGFSSGKVYLTFGLENARVGAKYLIYSISGNSFTNIPYDGAFPIITVNGEFGGTVLNGDKYTVSAASAMDVISPNVEIIVTVTAPNGEFVRDDNGVLLNGVDASVSYTISANSIGEYKIVYTAYELYEESGFNSGLFNVESFECFFFAEDSLAPQIIVNGFVPEIVNKGSIVVIPNYQVVDDSSSTEDISVRVIVTNPNGIVEYVPNDAFRCDLAGEYQLRIIALDEMGNTTMKTFNIQVNG